MPHLRDGLVVAKADCEGKNEGKLIWRIRVLLRAHYFHF
jgi:hypothetical protein